MKYTKARLFGRNKEGVYQGKIEQIQTGRPLKIFGKQFSPEKGDTLCICNRNFWLFAIFTYRQIGTFHVDYPHNFKERQNVIVIKDNYKIIEVQIDDKVQT